MDWTKEVGQPQAAPKADWASELTRPKTFDEANAAREAATTNTVDRRRLENAQGLRDMGLVDPREAGNPDVPIENFMRRDAPAIKPAEQGNFGAALKANLVEDPDTKVRLVSES